LIEKTKINKVRKKRDKRERGSLNRRFTFTHTRQKEQRLRFQMLTITNTAVKDVLWSLLGGKKDSTTVKKDSGLQR